MASPHVSMQHIVAHGKTWIFQVQATNGHFLSLILVYRDSDSIIGIRGNCTISPLNFPVKIVASRTFTVILLINKRVPLHNLGGYKLRKRTTGEQIFNRRLCGGIPIGKCTVSFSSTVVSIDLKDIQSPGNKCCI
ncbi:Uncharacterized protein FWK35_00016450 [Aphis craccivora]|uniref:Uncharacterized protein n=1 Tax=Aphis craccivora TaxID=307492 RepID=A0A6G0Z460_APHCR|nr:Uncharacterized protein FWK35_00016450 [Aphis craccivora]